MTWPPPGDDYTAVNSTITFWPTDKTKTVTVQTDGRPMVRGPGEHSPSPSPTPRAEEAWRP